MGDVKRYRKRPVEVEARQLGRDYDEDCEIVGWCGGWAVGPEDGYDENAMLIIYTLEGTHVARWGDWVIRGVKGEFYPCKPDIFEATYEPVDEERVT
jgi:hypothetical protein